jgi:hypothetical protein
VYRHAPLLCRAPQRAFKDEMEGVFETLPEYMEEA